MADEPKPNIDPRKAPEVVKNAADPRPLSDQPDARNTVFIGCKLPHGLRLQLYELGQTDEGKPVHVPIGESVKLNGGNAALVAPGGYGVTEVDAGFWEAWIGANKKFPAVKNGQIFVESRRDRAIDRSIDQREVKTGVEPIDPSKPGTGLEPVPEKELKERARQAGNF